MEELRKLLLSLHSSVTEANAKANAITIEQFRKLFHEAYPDKEQPAENQLSPGFVNIQLTPGNVSGRQQQVMKVPVICLAPPQLTCIDQIVIRLTVWVTRKEDKLSFQLSAPEKTKWWKKFLPEFSNKSNMPQAIVMEITIRRDDDDASISAIVENWMKNVSMSTL